jgi:3-dehydroquinate dehydratase/shikimate dehydrogenase
MTNKIAISITSKTLSEMLENISKANSLADFIELRLDYLEDKDLYKEAEEILKGAVQFRQPPLIFTYRSDKKEVVPNRSIQTFSKILSSRTGELSQDYFDFDLSKNNTVSFHLYSAYQRLFGKSPKIILSHHNFQECNEEELFAVYNRLATLTPEVIKIAAKANQVKDQLIIFSLLKTAIKENLNLIALAMGEMGQLSRILAPSMGSFLTFASLEKGKESAPGQFTLDEMLSLYRVKEINQDTKKFCLIGCPVGHSLSPHMHNAVLSVLGANAVYLPVFVPDNQLGDFVRDFLHPKTRKIDLNFGGASVTVPHKVAIQEFLDEIDKTAKEIGAVNTIVVKEDKLIGYNTDILGAILPLKSKLNLMGAKVTVLGAGGAARALVAGLKLQGAKITVYGRNKEKLTYLIDKFGVSGKFFDEFNKDSNESADLLVNTTPIGMKSWQSEINIPIKAQSLRNFSLVYDLVYNPLKTPLLEEAERQGINTLGGLEMLVAQAAEQLKLWTSLEPPLEIMYSAALKNLY